MFLKLPYFRKIIGSMSVAMPLINHNNTNSPLCAADAQSISTQFLCWKWKLHTPTHMYEVCVTINLLKLKLPIHAQIIWVGLNFSDLRVTGVSLILTLHIWLSKIDLKTLLLKHHPNFISWNIIWKPKKTTFLFILLSF